MGRLSFKYRLLGLWAIKGFAGEWELEMVCRNVLGIRISLGVEVGRPRWSSENMSFYL